ncbi:DoxX family protein [Devosia sediminis]|uniref:DoxX family protein n=1 Tax=Devosia sediminis TaxID=2798801 RepID=A0A934IYZ9_9HYPH|nr:DoxX family protein [Devosia sediminis]MBJ3785831.1 DoxX family protein [Devosia sediminis]
MIFGTYWAIALTATLGVFFLADGFVSLIGPKPMRVAFVRWGYPRWWHLVNAAVCLTIGVLLFIPPLRPIALILAALECLAIFATMIRNRQPAHLPPSVILLALVALAAWGLYAPA